MSSESPIICRNCGQEIVESEDGTFFVHVEDEVYHHIARPVRARRDESPFVLVHVTTAETIVRPLEVEEILGEEGPHGER